MTEKCGPQKRKMHLGWKTAKEERNLSIAKEHHKQTKKYIDVENTISKV